MARPYTTNYYFNRSSNLERFEHVSTDGAVVLDYIIGETLAAAFCDCDNPLELVRMHRHNETIIVRKRLSNLCLTITAYK